jgi:type I restriction enzyme S subunit
MSEKIPKGWKWVKLGEVAEIKMGQSPESKYYNDKGIGLPFLQGNKTFGYKYPEIDIFCSNPIKIAKKGEVLISVRAPVGDINITNQDICIGRGLASINSLFNQNEFLFYCLKYSKNDLLASETGTVFGSINKDTLNNFPILLPPLPEQKAIAEVLSSIDDKIELLHRQNKTLEEMAMTLFRQWFMGDNISNDIIELGSLVDIISGVSYKSTDLNPSTTAMVSLKCFDRNGGFRIDGFKEFTGNYKEQHIVKEGDLIVAHTDITQDAEVIGNPAIVISNPKYTKMVISMDIVKVIPKVNWISIEFLYFLMRTREFKGHCEGSANGSTVLHLSKQAIPTFEFKTPKREMVIEFTKQAKELLNKTFLNQRQILTLIHLRDTLLPKLMSGEVRVRVEIM